ncbi:porin [Rheinheimera soli]|uniref:Porin n=1 Tax=Rheinheimera soli TaxID=443616 RepID=A0ABU1VWZ3_9GAMM|nr:porin [Rheinheimera soli]MDR7120232.1 putative porin [Rheinheimera soli]
MFAKTFISIALALSCVATAQAKDWEIYGKINVSAQQSDEGEGSFGELKSNASRFGIKGDYALDGDLTLVYQLEWEVDPSDEANEKNIKSRDQFIGLAGAFGTVTAGRHDTALKVSQGKVDLFGDYEADIKTLWKGENRMSDSLAYTSPSFQGFKLVLSYVMEDDADAEDAQSYALVYGDDSLKDSSWYAAVALDSEINGYDTTRGTVQFKVADFKLGAMVQQQKAVATGEKSDGYLASLAYPLNKWELKAQYQTLEDDHGISVGADYKLGKNTKLFGWYTSFDFDSKVDSDYLAVGIEHKF